MKKILLFSLLVWLVSPSKSRAQWVESETLKNFNWNYDFSGGIGTVNGIGLEKISTPSVQDFLPKPSSGEARVATSADSETAGASFTLNGSCATSCLTMVHTGANGTAPAQPAPAKFVARNFAASSKIMNTHFKINLSNNPDNTQAVWYIVVGDAAVDELAGNTLAPSVSTNNTARDPLLYTVLRIRKVTAGNTYALQARYRNGNSTTWGWQTVADVNFTSGTEYTIDLFLNNTDQSQSYIANAVPKTVAAAAYHIYINGTQTANTNLTRNVVWRSTSDIRQYTGNLSGFSIMSRESAQTNGVNDNSASLTLSDLKITHLADESVTPVTLTEFDAHATNNGIALNWQTVSESNNSHFILNRSGDKTKFSVLGRIEGKGTTASISSYNYLDRSPLPGNNYYQLEQVDLDGTKTIINKIISVNYFVFGNVFNITAVSANQLNATISSEKDENVELQITDVSGRVLYKSNKNLKQGNNQIKLFIPVVTPGVYTAVLKRGKENRAVKFVL